MASVKCPECGERVKVREDGKLSRCAECGTAFRVKAKEDDEDEEKEEESPRPRPKRKPAPAKKSSGTKITTIVVGSLLIVGLIALGVVLIVRKGGKDGETQPVDQAKVTIDNFKNVKPGMDVAEVEGILGGSKSSSEDDMRDAFRKAFGDIAAGFEVGFAQFGEGTTWRRWEGNGLRVWVVFAQTKDGPRAAFSTALESIADGHKRVDGFFTQAGNHDLAKMNDQRKKEDAIRKDAKWVRGAQARDLLLGDWRDDLARGYAFAADGKLTEDNGVFMPGDRKPTYRVVNDRLLEIITPSLFNPPPGHPPSPLGKQPDVVQRFEYLVNRDELALIDASPMPIYGVRSYYRMPAVAGSIAEAKLVTPLIADVKSGDATKRQVALYKLQQLGKSAPMAIPALRDLAKQTKDPRARNEIESLIQAMERKSP
jgi:hypothetical protein